MNSNRKIYMSEGQLEPLGSRYNCCGFEMLVGIPGCGKSTYLKSVSNSNVLVVCPDNIRRELTSNISDQSRNGDVWRIAEKRINEGLKIGKYVILDATNVGARNRVGLLNKVKSINSNVRCYATVFDCNPEVSKERIAKDIKNGVDRSNVPSDVIDRMYSQYLETLKVIESEGFDDVFYYGENVNEERLLSENEWNFHFGKSHNGKPYISDNKFQMFGRETGHFGSGTYFSTYRNMKDIDNYGELSRNQNPNFIEVHDHVYRVDFDLYKNLYRVRSKRQGDILYTMMKNLNMMYNRIVSMGHFNPSKANYDNSDLYQVIMRNAEALSLRCPSYYELTRMAQRHEGVQSFSTLFMEWNGYNGVNVSGVDYYDNTKHGSVIYDLSKVDTEMEEVEPKSLYCGFKDTPYDDTIVSNGYGDEVVDSLRGEYIGWYNKLNEMPLVNAMRVLKNYTSSGNILDYYVVKKLNPELIKRYLRLIFVKNPNGYWDDPVLDKFVKGDESKYFAKLIDEYGAYYWINYVPRSKSYGSVLTNLLNNFAWNIGWDVDEAEERKMKEEYLDKLMSYMQRDLTEYEKEYIKEVYFDDDEQKV